MRNKSNVLIGAPDVSAAGGFSIGKVIRDDSNLPDDATTPLGESYEAKPGGYITEEGLTKTTDRSTEKIKDWNGDTVLIVQTEHGVSLQFTCMETANANVLKMIHGEDNVLVDEGKITVIDSGDELEPVSLDFLMLGGQGRKIRAFAPEASVTEVGEVQYVKTGVIQYPVTVECLDPFGDSKKLWQFMEGDGIGDDTDEPTDPEDP